VQTLVSTYERETQALSIPINANEPEAERQACEAKILAYRQGVEDIQQMWVTAYQQGFNGANEMMRTCTEIERVQWERRRTLYIAKMKAIPQPSVRHGRFAIREHVRAAIPIALMNRDQPLRLEFWKKSFTKDTLASQFAHFRYIIDIRRLADTDTKYSTMCLNRFAHAADEMHVNCCYPSDLKRRMVLHHTDIRIPSIIFNVKMNRVHYAYQAIREVHKRLGFNDPQFGTWRDVPVLETRPVSRMYAITDAGKHLNRSMRKRCRHLE
jgi:hypothetical protein